MVDSVSSLAAPVDAAPAQAGTQSFPPLRLGEKLVFGSGEMVEGVVAHALANFLLFYLTAVCGLSGSLAGLALFVTLIGDAFIDPVVGYWTDNSRSRWGRRHPFMLAAAIPLALGVGLLFSAPRVSDWLLFAYVVVALGMLRVAHSAFMLPYAALSAEISRDYKERSALGAYRLGFNTLTLVIVVFLGYSVFMRGPEGLLDRSAYAGFGWACGLLALVPALVCTVGTYRLRHRMHANAAQRLKLSRFARELGEVVRNRSFRILFMTILIFWVAIGAAVALGLHAGRYFWKLPTEVLQLLPIVYGGGIITGIPLTAFLLRFFEKQTVCVWGIGICCATLFALPVLFLLGLIPQSGPALHAILCSERIIVGWSFSAAVITFISMTTDSADEHELLYGSRREGLYFAGLTFSAKAAVGVGSLFSGAALDLIGFPSDLAAGAQVAPEVARNLGLVAGPGAAAIAAVSALILTGYNLNSRRFAEIQTELAKRRAGGPV